MEHPKDIGDRSTLAVMAALQQLGYGLYVPFSEKSRCDLISETNGKLVRLQCKTGRLRGGAIAFSLCSNYGHHRNPATRHRQYHGEIDVLAVYCPETSGVLGTDRRRAWQEPRVPPRRPAAEPATEASQTRITVRGRARRY